MKNKLLTLGLIFAFCFAINSTVIADENCPNCPPPPDCCDFGDMTAGLWINTNDIVNQTTNLACNFMETIEHGQQNGQGYLVVTPGVTGDISAFLYHNDIVDQSAQLPGGFDIQQFGVAESALYALTSAGQFCPEAGFDIASHRDASILNTALDTGMESKMHVDAGGHTNGYGLDVTLGMDHLGAFGYTFEGPNSEQTALVQFKYSGGEFPTVNNDN